MVLGAALRIAQFAIRHRNTIYKVLTAQDRVVGSSFRRGGYSKATQYGARHGALAGSVIGSIITANAPDSPGNEFSEPIQKRQRSATRSPYKTRYRPPSRYRSEYTTTGGTNRYKRCPRPRVY